MLDLRTRISIPSNMEISIESQRQQLRFFQHQSRSPLDLLEDQETLVVAVAALAESSRHQRLLSKSSTISWILLLPRVEVVLVRAIMQVLTAAVVLSPSSLEC